MTAWPFEGVVVQTAFIGWPGAYFLRRKALCRLFRGSRRSRAGRGGRCGRCVAGRGGGRRRGGRCRRLRLGARIDPAGMNSIVEAARYLVVDLGPEPGQAAEAGLDMAAGAAKAVIEVEVPERRIEVVQPHQANHAAAQPDAFGVAARAVDGLLGFDEFGCLAFVVLDGFSRLVVGGILALLVLGRRIAALGKGAAGPDQDGQGKGQGKGQRGRGKVTQDHTSKLNYPATHTFPDKLTFLRQDRARGIDAVQMGPECGGNGSRFP